MKHQQYEYAVFTVHVHYGAMLRDVPYIPPESWPDEVSQVELLDIMNKLGEEGWEIWHRTHPTLPPKTTDETYPFNLWARRVKP
jgi:hypothetical protein